MRTGRGEIRVDGEIENEASGDTKVSCSVSEMAAVSWSRGALG